ncbi:YbaN family protein [Candidatus Methanomassiliicoccus intestinalis]|jgi:hypothetical protein|uniref:DUF454 domain-containing protein n=1 Tax=Candidatus Methanomassiliicoccus intestinalis TaxID=1406512 RepID=A0A8J8TE94_9ARCH|nr:MAG: hypothetical protein A3207_00080 [Candidatus Methanomassiliicoccus intestinalis]
MKRTVCTILGTIAVMLGAVGIVLPVMPTVPFILAAAALFSAGNPKMHDWLINTKHFGPFIENYQSGRGIPRQLKFKTLVFLWIMLSISMFFTYKNSIVLLILMIVGILVSVHILTIKTQTTAD